MTNLKNKNMIFLKKLKLKLKNLYELLRKILSNLIAKFSKSNPKKTISWFIYKKKA